MIVPVQPANPNVPKFVSGPGSDKLNLYADAINGMQQAIRPPVQIFGGSGKPIVARITEADGTEYEWVEVELSVDDEWADKTDGLTSEILAPAQELNLSVDVPIDSIVQIFSALGGTGETTYWFVYGSASTTFVAKITGSSGPAFAWTEQYQIDATTWADLPDGRSGTTSVNPAYELNGSQSIATNTLVWITQNTDDSGTVRYTFVSPAVMFPVKVEQTGGSDGNNTTAASYTYTVRSLTGATLGTGVAQVRPRPNGAVTVQAGSTGYGVAFYDGLNLRLWDAGEIPQTQVCP